MSINDSLLKKRAALESMTQNYALAGLPTPDETQQEQFELKHEALLRTFISVAKALHRLRSNMPDFYHVICSQKTFWFLEPDDMLAFGICLYEAMTGVHPFNQRLAVPSPDESFEPTRLSAEISDTINFRRSLLQPYTTPLYILQPPIAIHPDLSEGLEEVLLKGLRTRVDRNGTIHSTPGFSDLQEFRAALQVLLGVQKEREDTFDRSH